MCHINSYPQSHLVCITSAQGGVLYNMTASALEVGGVPLNRYKRSRGKAQSSQFETRTSVPTVDLGRWLADRFCAKDSVDIKMDIEGAEFEVLEHLLRTKRAALIDTLAIEWHTTKRGQGGGRVTLQKRQAGILDSLRREGVRFIDWQDARPGGLRSQSSM